MSRWTNPVQVSKDFDAIKQFKEGRGIYRFSISRNIAYPKKAGKIVYIGKTGNLGGRIAKHLKKSTEIPYEHTLSLEIRFSFQSNDHMQNDVPISNPWKQTH